MNKKNIIVIILVVATLCFWVWKTYMTPMQSLPADKLVIANSTEIETVDPHLATGVPEHRVSLALFECLYRYDPKTSEAIPGAAEKCETTDGLTYTCKIRKNAKWSNGGDLTAHDFEYSLKRILNPATGSQYASMLYPIKNAKAVNEGTLKDMNQVGVKATDAKTLRLTLAHPTPYFTSMIAHYTYCPVPKDVVEKHGNKWTSPENFVGNGPYVLTYSKLQEKKIVTKNPYYWDKDNVHIDEIVFYPTDNASTMVRQFQNNEVHWSTDIPTTEISTFKNTPQYKTGLYLGTYYYRINVTKPPFNDVRVRRALAMSLNRKLLTDKVTKAGQVPALSFVPPGTLNYGNLNSPLTEDVEKAKALLAEAGFPGGNGMAPVEILYNTLEAHKLLALAIGQMWKKNLGIEVKPFNKEWKTYLQDQRMLNFQVCRAGWIADYNDPSTFLDMFTTDNDLNQTGWSNKQYDQLLASANAEKDLSKRKNFLMQAEKILMEELPVIPIYFYVSKNLVSDSVAGWHDNILDVHPYVGMKLTVGKK